MEPARSKTRAGLWTVAALLFFGALPVFGIPRSWLLFLFLFFIYLAMANAWNLLAGYSGLISLCQPAFVGLGAYTVTLLAWVGVPLYVGIIAGIGISAAFAVIISVPAFRMKGTYFAIGTLIVPEVLRLVFLVWRPVGGDVVGGGAGYAIKRATEMPAAHIYWMALTVGIVSVFVLRIILGSSLGLGLAAVRDNEKSSASSGVNVFRLKLTSFVIGAVITGAAGGVFYVFQGYVDPTSAFSIQWTIALMLATVLGGIGTEEGPIVGTAIVVLLHFLLAKYAGVSLLIQGFILTGIMLITPQGIAGYLRQKQVYRSFMPVAKGRS
ncbi:MAG: branched-chain amino acid ABC transporter permease [Pseudomonadota bacterium]